MTVFMIEADEGVQEAWQWQTDVLTARRGDENRLSLQPAPDVTQTISINPINQTTRGRFWINLAQDLDGPATYPLFGWGAAVSAPAGPTDTVVQCDTLAMSLNNEDYVVFLNPESGDLVQRQATSRTDTSVTLTSPLGRDIDTQWVAYKGMRALLGNENRISMRSVTGRLTLPMSSFEWPYVQRSSASVSLTLFNGTPILEREALQGLEENLEWPRDLTDFGLGRYNVFSRRRVVRVNRRRVTFLVNRLDTDDVDYWRLFLDTVRGSWRVFLVSTQLADIQLLTGLVQGGTTLTATDSNLGDLFLTHRSFASFEILYDDGTTSRHAAIGVVGNVVTFSPALPNDPKVANVSRISYLLRARMADRLQWVHEITRSRLTFDLVTTDNG